MTPESYTKFHNLEFKIPKGFNVTKNSNNDLIMTTKGTYFKNYSSSYIGFDLAKNKDIGAISITYLSKNNLKNSDNDSLNNIFNSSLSNSSDNSKNSTMDSSFNNHNSNSSSNVSTMDDSISNNLTSKDNSTDTNDSSEDIDFSKISISNPSNNFTVDGITIFRMSKMGVKTYIFTYENSSYAISLYSVNSTNNSETDEFSDL